MYRTKVSTGGRITIPVELRKKLRLKRGTLLTVREENGRLVLISIKRLLDGMRGCLKPRPGKLSMFEALFEERKRERMREKS